MDQEPQKQEAMIIGKDRISGLPDDIICEILSRLPTKNAVATTILSKRWKDQWTKCFNLDITDSYLVEYADKDKVTCFVNSIKHVIALNSSPSIKKLQWLTETMDETDVTACIDSILMRNVEEIEFDATTCQELTVTLPQSLFTCKTLVFLDIVSHISDIPPLVHLPSLKVFRVNLCDPIDVVTTERFCGLPVLEDLSVSISLLRAKEMRLNIIIPSLKRLNLELEKCELDLSDCKIFVRAPSLKELDIYDDILANYVFEELPLDVKACLQLGRCAHQFVEQEHAARAVQVMNQFSGVKSLVLASQTLGTLSFYNEPDRVAVFPNLTFLEVNVTDCCGWTYLLYLIDKLPSLVFLVLEMEPSHWGFSKRFMYGAFLRHVPQCLLLRLNKIEVRGFEGQEYGLQLVRFLLRFAQVLGEMVIHTPTMALEERKNLWQKLSSFPRGSTNRQLKMVCKISKDRT